MTKLSSINDEEQPTQIIMMQTQSTPADHLELQHTLTKLGEELTKCNATTSKDGYKGNVNKKQKTWESYVNYFHH